MLMTTPMTLLDDWLTEVRKNGVSMASYTYDANGNRLSHMSQSGTVTGSYDAQDRLISS